MKKLLIIESGGKVPTISKYLGKDWIVYPTNGHIRDIKRKDSKYKFYGFDLKTFDIDWGICNYGDGKKIKEMNDLANEVEEVYIATDPDREGEAIGWHVKEVLTKKNQVKCKRISFNVIDKETIMNAIDHPTILNMDYIHSQFARRILDRYMGFRLGYYVKRNVEGMGAGRVQSVVLKLIVDREKEIEATPVSDWYELNPKLENDTILSDVKKQKFTSLETIKAHISTLDKSFLLEQKDFIQESAVTRKRPCITSDVIASCTTALKLPLKEVVNILNQLYQGVWINNQKVALLSYPRTDSATLSVGFCDKAISYVKQAFKKDDCDDSCWFNKMKQRDSAQEAHEAIRPVDIDLTPQSLKNNLKPEFWYVYNYVWTLTVACFMKPAMQKHYQLQFDNNGQKFISKFKETSYVGHLQVFNPIIEDDAPIDEEQDAAKTNDLEVKKSYPAKNYSRMYAKKKTTLPSRYTESSIIKKLEELEIGRPATYAKMVEKNLEHKYIKKDGKRSYIPTQLGLNVNHYLDKNFIDFINTKFTKEMEDDLNRIASGEINWIDDYLKGFINKLNLCLRQLTVPRY